jgi:hypothetical protein
MKLVKIIHVIQNALFYGIFIFTYFSLEYIFYEFLCLNVRTPLLN